MYNKEQIYCIVRSSLSTTIYETHVVTSVNLSIGYYGCYLTIGADATVSQKFVMYRHGVTASHFILTHITPVCSALYNIHLSVDRKYILFFIPPMRAHCNTSELKLLLICWVQCFQFGEGLCFVFVGWIVIQLFHFEIVSRVHSNCSEYFCEFS